MHSTPVRWLSINYLQLVQNLTWGYLDTQCLKTFNALIIAVDVLLTEHLADAEAKVINI